MNREDHIISSILFDISIEEENDAESFYRRTSQVVHSRLASRFDKIANQYNKKGFTSIFESVDLDIGEVSEENFESDVEEAIAEALSHYFKYNLNDFNSNLEQISDFDYYAGHLDHFLKYGYFSWKGGKQMNFNKILEFIAANYPDRTKVFIKKFSKSKSVNKRFTNNINNDNLELIFSLFLPSVKIHFQTLVSRAEKKMNLQSLSHTNLKYETWMVLILNYFSINEQSVNSDELISAVATQLKNKINLSDEPSKNHEALTNSNEEHQLTLFFLWFEQEMSQSNVSIEDISTNQAKLFLDQYYKENKLDTKSYRHIDAKLEELAKEETIEETYSTDQWQDENLNWMDMVENDLDRTSQFLSEAIRTKFIPKKLLNQLTEYAARLVGNHQLYEQNDILGFIEIKSVKQSLFTADKVRDFIREIKKFRSWRWLNQLDIIFKIYQERFVNYDNRRNMTDVRLSVFSKVITSSKKEIGNHTFQELYRLLAGNKSISTTWQSFSREIHFHERNQEWMQNTILPDSNYIIDFVSALSSFTNSHADSGTILFGQKPFSKFPKSLQKSQGKEPKSKSIEIGLELEKSNKALYRQLHLILSNLSPEQKGSSEIFTQEFKEMISIDKASLFLSIDKVRESLSSVLTLDSIIDCIENLTTKDSKKWSEQFVAFIHELTKSNVDSKDIRLVAEFKDRLLYALTVKPIQNVNRDFWKEVFVKALTSVYSPQNLNEMLTTLTMDESKKEIIELAKNSTDKIQISSEEAGVEKTEFLVNQTENQKWFIENSGLVLIAVFIPTLFQKLDIQQNNEFSHSKDQDKGICILQQLCSGSSFFEESELVLNKVLCGVDPFTIVEIQNEFSDFELEMITSLIEGVKAQWSHVGNTSYQGLIESFFMREGRLIEKPDEFELTVNKRSYDMLLDSIPWNFTIVKFSWMKKALKVVWN